jgi:mono/diheme cytochrome c family protein
MVSSTMKQSSTTRRSLLLGTILAVSTLAACRGETSQDPPFVPIRNMYDQPRYDMQSESEFFADGRTMRAPVDGTVSREAITDPRIARGRLEDESGYVLTIPSEVIEKAGGMPALVSRGQDRYGIYCAVCHGLSGHGDGVVVKRGMLPPPTYHQDRLRHAPDGQIYATIQNGKGNMPPYAAQLAVEDRWAIVAYVRALQLSQAPLAKEGNK